jgi:hypothetical protein
MSDRHDDDGPVWPGFLVMLVACCVLAGVIITTVAFISVHTAQVSCLRLHEQTNLPTKYARSGANGECYVQLHDGTWVPQQNWASTKEAW